MSTKMQEKAIVRLLGIRMLAKLRENRLKKHWRSADMSYLISRLIDEVVELIVEVKKDKPDSEAVWSEAADVANFAAMMADNIRFEEKLRNLDEQAQAATDS